MVPLRYTVRSVGQRKIRTAMTVVGVACAVAIYAVMSSVGSAMVRSFRTTGAPDELVLAQTGALTTEFSNVPRGSLAYVQTLDGVAARNGRPLVSPELWLQSVLQTDGRGRDASVRGVTSTAPLVYRQVRLAEGRWPGPGHEAAMGRAVAGRLGLTLGDTLRFEGVPWAMVGVLDAGGRVYDQEIWVDLDELAAAANRLSYSSYTVVAVDTAVIPALIEGVNEGRRYPMAAQRAGTFYARTGGMQVFMAYLGTFISIIVAIGAGFGGMNTMYAAVAGRRREIGVLRALGYGRTAILTSFLLESLLLCLVGGILGLALGSVLSMVRVDLPLLPSSHIALGPEQVLRSVALALGVGVLGGGLPALQAARLAVVDALR
jgi:ABC-type lipoprotein release transport system permease subunit